MIALKNALLIGNMAKNRLEAFSDGVIAVIITILVLDVHLPAVHLESGQLAQEILKLMPKIASYVVSFGVVAVWWVAHHQLFHIVNRTDRGFLWLNSLFLLFLSFIPFPTAVVGDYPLQFPSVLLYGITGVLTGLSFSLLRWYATLKSGLVNEVIPVEKLRMGFRRGLISPALYAFGIAIGFFVPAIGLAVFAFIPCFYFIPSLLDRHDHELEKKEI